MLVLLVVAEARLSCSGKRSAKSVYSHANIFCRRLAGSKGQPGTLTEGTMALVLPGVDMPVVTTGDMTGSELVVAVTLRIMLGVAEKVGRSSAAIDVVAGDTPSLAWGLKPLALPFSKGEGLECMINAMGVAATVGVGRQQQQWGRGSNSSSGGRAATAVGAGRPQQQWGRGGHSSSGGGAATAVGTGRPQQQWGRGGHSSSSCGAQQQQLWGQSAWPELWGSGQTVALGAD